MSLMLVAVSLDEQPLSQPITAAFDARGGTVGRADHNTMALPDPQRHVSRLQAEIVALGSGYRIRNVGTNPIVVGGRRLGHGELSPVTHGDSIRVGGYLLRATIGEDEPTIAPQSIERVRPPGSRTAPAVPLSTGTWPLSPPGAASAIAGLTPARTRTPAPEAGPAPGSVPFVPASPAPPALSPPAASPEAPGVSAASASNPFADLLPGVPGLSQENPFADLLGPVSAPAAVQPERPPHPFGDLLPPIQGVQPASAAVASPPVPTPLARPPEHFDPFAALAAPPAPSAEKGGAFNDDPFADLMPASGSPSIDAVFGLAAGGDAASLSAFEAGASGLPAAAPPSGEGGSEPSTDPLAMFSDPSPASGASARAQADRLPAINSAFTPPRPARPLEPERVSTPASPPVDMGAARVTEPSGDALWQAFCDGAGLSADAAAGTPEDMRRLGEILRSAVAGTLQLMSVRGSTKHELRADVTVIQQRDNNPLKFTPDAATALAQLLRPPLRGFLDGPAAMDDAMFDLVGHSIGTVAGLRAAVEGMLARFAPEPLERKLVGGSVIDSLLPMARKARLWELYLSHHEAIREEAQEDFHTLFGKAFLAAYQQQIERLKREARR